MNEGEVSMEIRLPDFVLGSPGGSTLLFADTNQIAVAVMNPSDRKPALRCESCGYFMILTDAEYTDTQCVVCKSVMPAGTSSCPACGWTYKEI